MIETSPLRRKLLQLAVTGKLSAECRVRSLESVSTTDSTDCTDGRARSPVSAEAKPSSQSESLEQCAPSDSDGRARTPTAPPGWKTVKLGEVCDVQLGKMLDRGKNSGKAYKYLANVNVRWGAFDLTDLKETLFSEGDVEKFSLCRGDLLMCEGGVPGRCAIWRDDDSDIKYQKAIHRIRPSASILSEYLQVFFEAVHDKPSFTRKFTGSTIHHLPREVLINVEIPLPPLAEQKAIVKRLEELLALEREIAADSAALDDLIATAKRKILQLAVTGKLSAECRVRSAEWVSTTDSTDCKDGRARSPVSAEAKPSSQSEQCAPHGWKTVKLGEVVELLSGQDFPPSDYNDQSKGIPYITGASNLLDCGVFVNRWTETPTIISRRGDILLTCKGSGVGKISVLDVSEAHIARQIMAIRCGASIERGYMDVYLRSMFDYFRQNANGLIPGVPRKLVLGLEIPLPPLAEQKAIVAKVEELFAVLDAMKGGGR